MLMRVLPLISTSAVLCATEKKIMFNHFRFGFSFSLVKAITCRYARRMHDEIDFVVRLFDEKFTAKSSKGRKFVLFIEFISWFNKKSAFVVQQQIFFSGGTIEKGWEDFVALAGRLN